MNEEIKTRFCFGDFELDTDRRLLRKQGAPVKLKPKTLELLLTLVENRGAVLTKDHLLDRVWENQFVEENNLTVHIAALRKALGETKRENRFIATVPGKGYSFVAEIDEQSSGEIVVESRTFERIIVEEQIEIQTSPTETNGHHTANITQSSPADRSSIRKKFLLAAALPVVLLIGALGYWLYSGGNLRSTAPSSFQEAPVTRLTASGKVNGAAVSPDGKYFVYAQLEPEGQSLWVRQVRESRSIQIMPADAVEYWGLTFSPDGTQIYATVFTATQADPKLIRVPTFGGVVENLPNVSCSGISFSPDGKRFAYVVSSGGAGGTLLRTANADGSDDKFLAIMKDPSFFVYPGPTVAWSPDGETIACATRIVDDTGYRGAVMAVNVADGRMSQLTTTRFPWVQSVSWMPKGQGLMIAASDDATSPLQVWHQPLPNGEAKRVSNDLNSYGWIGATKDGNEIVATQHTLTSGMWVADYPDGLAAPRQIASEIGDYGELGWSREGKLIFSSRASGKQNLWTVKADGTDQRQLTTDAVPNLSLSVSPDGQYIVFSSFRTGKPNLWRANADGSNLTQLTYGTGEAYPRITPDGLSVIYQQGVGEVVSHLWKIPIEGGDAQQITKTHSIFPSLSPDGKLVAYFYMDRSKTTQGEWSIGIANSSDGSLVRSFKMPEHIIGRVVRWTPDNASIVYAEANGNIGNLWKQSLDGGEPVQITRFDKDLIMDFAWSPDGRSLALTRSSEIRDLVLLTRSE